MKIEWKLKMDRWHSDIYDVHTSSRFENTSRDDSTFADVYNIMHRPPTHTCADCETCGVR